MFVHMFRYFLPMLGLWGLWSDEVGLVLRGGWWVCLYVCVDREGGEMVEGDEVLPPRTV